MKFEKVFTVRVEIDTVAKTAISIVQEMDGKTYSIEYVGDGTELHAIMENNGKVINLETFRESLLHILKYSSKILYTRYQDVCRDVYYRRQASLIKELPKDTEEDVA